MPKQPVIETEESEDKRGQFTDMTVPQLRELYLRELGRPTNSFDRGYLEWKIRQARNGKVRIGPRSKREGMPDPKQVAVRFEVHELEAIDASIPFGDFKDRMAFFRSAVITQIRAMLKTATSAKAKKALSAALEKFDDD
jgi:hypothetical protein